MRVSIQVKMSIYIALAMILCSIVVGGISIAALNETVADYSDEYIQLVCEKNALEINNMLDEADRTDDELAEKLDDITEYVSHIKLYESGYAYLKGVNGKIVYHPYLEQEADDTIETSWKKYENRLNNGMRLVMTVPESEITSIGTALVRKIVAVAFSMVVAAVLASALILNSMLSPLKQLNKAAGQVAAGDYGVTFEKRRSKDEIGQLTEYVDKIVKSLKDYMVYVDSLAYTDSLTGVKNKNAYDAMVLQLEKGFLAGETKQFGIVLLNINGLKKVNDTDGHEKGNKLIIAASRIISAVYAGSEVYRVAGDEFVVLITDSNLTRREELFEQLKRQMRNTWEEKEAWERISIACGWSLYNSELDRGLIENVYKRADAAMHDNKNRMKRENY